MLQTEFLGILKEKLPSGTSLNEAIAQALDISYDAAHRRSSMKSKFSLAESVLLAKAYGISLDALFATTNQHMVVVEKTATITSEEQLTDYFNASYESLVNLGKGSRSSLLYSAKDLPIFYLLSGDILTRFKCYVWLKLLGDSLVNIHFSSFQPKLATVEAAKKLSSVYEKAPVAEIWDITTVNSTLKQIHFYYEAGLLVLEDAMALCSAVKKVVENVFQKMQSKDTPFTLYYNELLLMNNQVLVTMDSQRLLYIPFSMLSYFLTNDVRTCEQASVYFKQQLDHSKTLHTTGEKEQHTFFNKIFRKIEALEQLLSATQALDFQ